MPYSLVTSHMIVLIAFFVISIHFLLYLLHLPPGSPLLSMLLAPAVTPWETTLAGVIGGAGNNPSIRLVEYDRHTGAALNVHQYYLNLTQANADR